MTPLGGSTQISKQNNVTTKVPIMKQNGTASVYSKQLELKGKVYKLMIQIDKIRAKPGPKCKKPALLAASRREKMGKIREIFHRQSGDHFHEDVMVKNNLEQVAMEPEMSENQRIIRNQCPVCLEHLESLLELFNHHETKHFVCQLCNAPFASQVACDKHETLHQGNDGLLIYKCHLCDRSYDCPRNLKVHVKECHWQVVDVGWKVGSEEVKGVIERLVYECGICRVSLKDEENYRNHMALHQINVDSPILNAPEKISEMHLSDQQNLKLTCTICTQTFDTPDAAEAHTCSSFKTDELFKNCSICKKVFNNNESLNQHLAGHLSRAHHCTVCRKLFVNRVTLKNHMKTHGNHT